MSNYTNFDLRNFLAEGKNKKEESVDEAGPGFAHDCAAHVVHETYGYGVCIEGQHTLVENTETGKHEVTHYDVFFKSGETVNNIPVNELDIRSLEEHSHGKRKKNEDTVEEAEGGILGKIGQLIDKALGLDKFNECVSTNFASDECKKIKEKMHLDASTAVDPIAGPKSFEEGKEELTKEEVFKNEIKDILDS